MLQARWWSVCSPSSLRRFSTFSRCRAMPVLPKTNLAYARNASVVCPRPTELYRNFSTKREIPLDLKDVPTERIRNFSIIAHIDHGKSTLADRLLELTGTITTKKDNAQVLDKLQVERERGITVKAQTASLVYTYEGQKYLLNLIDTPGHVDFSYEVSRSLLACQGAILLVDACSGVQAQTLANFFLAFGMDLAIVPVINKIDIETAQPEKVAVQLKTHLDMKPEDILYISAKTGVGLDQVLPTIIKRIPPPTGDPKEPLRALLFDSWYDSYRGVITLMEVVDGYLQKGHVIESANSRKKYEVLEVGMMYPEMVPTAGIYTGQVGYVITNMKETKEARVGDTFFWEKHSHEKAFPGFKPAKSMVFAGLYPIDADDYYSLKVAIDRLILNDASVSVQVESSASLGTGFRCGFLGLLHMDVFRERLEQEYDANIIITSPTVPYKAVMRGDKVISVENAAKCPEGQDVLYFEEPIVNATIVTPLNCLGAMIELCQDRRGEQLEMTTLDDSRILLRYRLPLSEIVMDFYDKLKSLSSGFASLDYEDAGYRQSDVVKMTIMVNREPIDALSFMCHREKVQAFGRDLVSKLKTLLPRQQYEVAIQAAVGTKVVARETLSAMRKNVTAKCYGGDISRKRKLLDKQKEGKKKMKRLGSIDISSETFMGLLKTDT